MFHKSNHTPAEAKVDVFQANFIKQRFFHPSGRGKEKSKHFSKSFPQP